MNKIIEKDDLQNDLAKIFARIFVRDNTILESIHSGNLDIRKNEVMKMFIKDVVNNMAVMLYLLENRKLEYISNRPLTRAIANSAVRDYDNPDLEKVRELVKYFIEGATNDNIKEVN